MSESKNKDVNDFENLNIKDDFDEDDGYDYESKKESNGRLEMLFQTNELQDRAKTKKPTETLKPQQLKTLKPRPDGKDIIIIPSNQLLNANGAQLFFDIASNKIIQLNTNMNSSQQQQNIQIQNIKNQLQQTVTRQMTSLVNPNSYTNQSDQFYTPVQSPLINDNSVSWVSSSSQSSNSLPSTPGIANIDDFIDSCIMPQQEVRRAGLLENSLNSFSENFRNLTNNVPLDERDICSAEIALLPSLDSILKLKKDRGETFIHQLAQSKQIMHTTQALKKNQQRDTNLNIRLTSNIFMESIIERARSDQINLVNQQTLLYDLVNVKNDLNMTPIIFAVQKDRDDFCRLLLENGANPNIFTIPEMQTALHKSSLSGATNSFTILMQYFYLKEENRFSINQIDAKGNTALATAIENHSKSMQINNRLVKINNLFIINELITANADTKTVNFQNNSCSHLVFLNNDCSIEDKLKILKMLSVSLYQLTEVKNIYGKNAFDCWESIIKFNNPQELLQKIELMGEIPGGNYSY